MSIKKVNEHPFASAQNGGEQRYEPVTSFPEVMSAHRARI